MNTFIGKIEARLDDKGRTFIPAGYRKILAEYDSRRVVMRREPGTDYIVFYPEDIWNQRVNALKEQLDEWDPTEMMTLMQFVGDAQTVEPDSQGRVLIQKRDLEQIGAESDVLFVGMVNRFALWAPQRFEAQCVAPQDLQDTLRRKMKRTPNN